MIDSSTHARCERGHHWAPLEDFQGVLLSGKPKTFVICKACRAVINASNKRHSASKKKTEIKDVVHVRPKNNNHSELNKLWSAQK